MLSIIILVTKKKKNLNKRVSCRPVALNQDLYLTLLGNYLGRVPGFLKRFGSLHDPGKPHSPASLLRVRRVGGSVGLAGDARKGIA